MVCSGNSSTQEAEARGSRNQQFRLASATTECKTLSTKANSSYLEILLDTSFPRNVKGKVSFHTDTKNTLCFALY